LILEFVSIVIVMMFMRRLRSQKMSNELEKDILFIGLFILTLAFISLIV
jgi:hypothetical protein